MRKRESKFVTEIGIHAILEVYPDFSSLFYLENNLYLVKALDCEETFD